MARSLDRGLAILEALAKSPRSLGVSELGRLLDIDKASVHRLLAVLARRGYIEQDPVTRRYACTPRIMELSAVLLAQMDLPRRAWPYLRELVQRTGQSAHLAVLARGSPQWAVYIGEERSASHIQVDVRVGEMAPTHCTAVGKALIAYLPEASLRPLATPGALERYTPRTITSFPDLARHLAQVRARGYAVDDEEFHLNIRCIGAPVRDNTGVVVASLGISGIAAELPLATVQDKAGVVTEVADRLSQVLGFTSLAAAGTSG